MIVMSIFLILSVVLIIGTAIYTNQKKNKENNIEVNKKDEEQKNIKNNSEKQLSDIFKIKIKDNIIKQGNRYSSIIRLGNIDYNMLSDTEQEAVENILIQTALSIDYPVQFFSTTEFIDTTAVIDEIKENKAKNWQIREYKEYLINYLNNLMENRSISVIKNYAIISYDGLYQNAVDELNRKALSFKSSLLRAKISCEILKEADLYNLLYRELNKNSNLKVDVLRKGVNELYVGKKQENEKRRN